MASPQITIVPRRMVSMHRRSIRPPPLLVPPIATPKNLPEYFDPWQILVSNDYVEFLKNSRFLFDVFMDNQDTSHMSEFAISALKRSTWDEINSQSSMVHRITSYICSESGLQNILNGLIKALADEDRKMLDSMISYQAHYCLETIKVVEQLDKSHPSFVNNIGISDQFQYIVDQMDKMNIAKKVNYTSNRRKDAINCIIDKSPRHMQLSEERAIRYSQND